MPAKSRDMTSFQIKGAERTSWRLWPKTFLGILWKETKEKKHKNTTASPKKKQFCYNFAFRNWAKNRLDSTQQIQDFYQRLHHCRDAPNAVAPFFPLWHLVESFASCFKKKWVNCNFSGSSQLFLKVPKIKTDPESIRKQATEHIWLVVVIILKNISQWEGLSHILWKIKNVPNHQPGTHLPWCFMFWIKSTVAGWS